MRIKLLIILCTISVTASAQFWKKKPKPVVQEVFPRFEEVEQPSHLSYFDISDANFTMPEVYFVPFKRSVYDIEIAEDEVMKEAKHDMRYREYKLASYDFTSLAGLYILQNRFSEAKWYLLQSNELSRDLKDDKHVISNLLTLAALKFAIGEPALAKTDLQEAYDLANAKGFIEDVAIIAKKIQDLEANKSLSPKAELHYAQAVEKSNKSH